MHWMLYLHIKFLELISGWFATRIITIKNFSIRMSKRNFTPWASTTSLFDPSKGWRKLIKATFSLWLAWIGLVKSNFLSLLALQSQVTCFFKINSSWIEKLHPKLRFGHLLQQDSQTTAKLWEELEDSYLKHLEQYNPATVILLTKNKFCYHNNKEVLKIYININNTAIDKCKKKTLLLYSYEFYEVIKHGLISMELNIFVLILLKNLFYFQIKFQIKNVC